MFIVMAGIEVLHSFRSAMFRALSLWTRLTRFEQILAVDRTELSTPKGVRHLYSYPVYKHVTPPE